MTTTIMKDSKVGDQWIMQACQQNPIGFVTNPQTGQPTENISSGPVRLAFVNLEKAQQNAQNPSAPPKFGVMGIYPPPNVQSYQLLYNEYYRILGREWPQNYVNGQFHGLESPFHDQASKMKYSGFTPGSIYINHTTQFRIPVVDTNHNPITDFATRVYAGVWAILVVNPYHYGKAPPQPKKGVSFGLQAVMIIGDDQRLDGAAIDPRMAFAGARVSPPAVNPASLGGLVPAPVGMPGAPVAPQIPGMPPHMPFTMPSAPPSVPGLPQARDDMSSLY